MPLDLLPDIFTVTEAHTAGLNGTRLTQLVRQGTICRLGRGVYRQGGPTGDPREVTRAHSVTLSRQSAAAWWGADVPYPPARMQVTMRRARKPRQRDLDIHRADLEPDEIVQFRGVLVTAPTRTVLDVARSLPLAQAVAVGDSMCRLGRCRPEEVLSAAIALPAGPGRPAAVRVAELLDPRAESVFESISRVTIVVAGLPMPHLQFTVYTDDGVWIGRVDFAWPELRVILECDGFTYHGSRESFEHDRRRWSALTRAGLRVVVVTWRDVLNDPAYLVDLIGSFVPTYN